MVAGGCTSISTPRHLNPRGSMARMTDEEWRGMSDEEFQAAREKDIPEWWKRLHHVPKTLLKALFFAALAALFAKAFYDNMGGGG